MKVRYPTLADSVASQEQAEPLVHLHHELPPALLKHLRMLAVEREVKLQTLVGELLEAGLPGVGADAERLHPTEELMKYLTVRVPKHLRKDINRLASRLELTSRDVTYAALRRGLVLLIDEAL